MEFKNSIIFPPTPELDSLALTVLPPNSHEYALTNRKSMHWSCESNKSETRKWHGLVVDRWTLITNFWLDTSTVTTEKNVVTTSIFPHKVDTSFVKEEGQFVESMFLVRNQDLLIIQYKSNFSANVKFRLQLGMRRDWEAESQIATSLYDSGSGILFISMEDTSYEGPKQIGISLSTNSSFLENRQRLTKYYEKDHYRGDGHDNESIIEVGTLAFNLKQDEPVNVVIMHGETRQEIIDTFNHKTYLEWWNQTINPLLSLIKKNMIELTNLRWNQALKWAMLSLDSLSMNVKGQGIYAGIPWFVEYWGRDSFISFRGAMLSSRNSEVGREWIRTMAKFQDRDLGSFTFGRVPNIIQVDNPHPNYETADGTGWFIRSIYDFFQMFGLDHGFLREIWSSVVVALKGEISRTDSDGFLIHEQRGTWMDAQTDNIIATPRGNRAVEIQVLFFVALDIGRRLALLMDDEERATKWNKRMDKLKTNFLMKFWNYEDNSLYDHLNDDDFPDLQKRPNGIFAITLPLPDNPLLNLNEERWVLEDVVKNCLAPHGIRSLSQDDLTYHPLHDYGSKKGEEHHDFSYHNGDVWLWLSGPVIESSLKHGQYKIATQLTAVLTERILTRDALGTLAEIMDGTDEDFFGNSRGTISQAWSLAEYLRTFYTSWLGIATFAMERTLRLTPIIHEGILGSQVLFPLNEGRITIEYQKLSPTHIKIYLAMNDFVIPITLQIQLFSHQTEKLPILIDGTKEIPFRRGKRDYLLQLDNYLYEKRVLSIGFK
ncbi:MAG: amylo-alpha-1,6-glucosidase [Candidatus Hodarchaeales archaeon]|jgi:predicted glycogen debranching enzyme